MAGFTPYLAAQLTLTTQDTNYSLYALLTAIDANAPPAAVGLGIQSEDGDILIGDVNLSATRYGYKLTAGNSRIYSATGAANLPVAAIYLRCAVAGKKVNVEVYVN